MLLKGLAKLECSLMDTGALRFSFSFISNLKDYKKTYHITLSAQKKWLHDKSIFLKNYSTCSKNISFYIPLKRVVFSQHEKKYLIYKVKLS